MGHPVLTGSPSKPLKRDAAAVDRRGVTRLRNSGGFTLIEVIMASLIVLIGAGAAFSMIESANRAVTSNAARVAATNLARELTEYARTTDYDLLQPNQIVPALRRHTSIAGTLTGSAWQIERRNVTYTVAASVCTFDDPKDGLAATPPANACPAAAPVAGAPAEVNPDDFRRVRYTLNWTARNRSGSLTQAAIVVNPAGGLGPRITRFDEPSSQITGDSQSWGAAPLPQLTSTSATSVRWTTDDGVNAGDAAGGPTDWGFTWSFGPAFSTTAHWVRDGIYTIEVQAKDSRGVPGEAVLKTIHLNRHPPAAITGFAGGYNEREGAVDMRWDRYEERDLKGYVVYRNADGARICDVQQERTCTDRNPLPTGSDYQVQAADCTDLKAAACGLRFGTPAFTGEIESSATTPAPDKPTGLTASVIDGKPTLSWIAPATVPNGPVRFYRIYRNGIRHDETVTNSPTYVDPKPGNTTAHTYSVTAVDQDFNESEPSDPVQAPPVT
jgi:prepilin-type N-terminal cleavage/methylation domain-containing protein